MYKESIIGAAITAAFSGYNPVYSIPSSKDTYNEPFWAKIGNESDRNYWKNKAEKSDKKKKAAKKARKRNRK